MRFKIDIDKVFLNASLVILALMIVSLLVDYAYREIRIMLVITYLTWVLLKIRYLPAFLREGNMALFILLLAVTLLVCLIGPNSGHGHYSSIRELTIALGLIFLGNNLRIDDDVLIKSLRIFIFVLSGLSVLIVFILGEGFRITDQYFFDSKNHLSPLLMTGIIVIVFDLLHNNHGRGLRLLLFLTMVILFSSIVTLRGRSAIMGTIISLLVLFLLELQLRPLKWLIALFSGIALIGSLAVFTNLFGFLIDAFIANYDWKDIESFSAFRVSTYLKSLNFIKENLFFGELLSVNLQEKIPHNYIIHKTQLFGLLGVLPLIIIYFGLGIIVVFYLFRRHRFEFNRYFLFPLYTLFASYLISLVEYTFPYGPGSTQFITFLAFGFFLGKTRDEKKRRRYF